MPASSASRFSSESAALGTPPLCLSARTVATTTHASGRIPDMRHLMSQELLGTEVCAEARLGHDVVAELRPPRRWP